MEWVGLFSDNKVPAGTKTYLDALCSLFKEKYDFLFVEFSKNFHFRLVYGPGERDMLVMRHDFVVEYPDRKEYISSTMLDYGLETGNARTLP
jgi:saccharopine dehydrogenase (NADP+, L-glutamate forming)